MASNEELLMFYMLNNNLNPQTHEFFNMKETHDHEPYELNLIDIGLDTKYIKNLVTYNELVSELKILQENKFPDKIKNIIDITINYKKYDFYRLDNQEETYNNILYDIKNYYICEITEENKNFFLNFINKKKIKPQNKYAMIFNSINIYLICLKNNIDTIKTQLETNIKLFGTPNNIIDSNEFVDSIINYTKNKNIQICNLTEQITNISIKSKVNMINTFINETTNTNTKKYNKYIEDINNVINNLDKNKIYICNTTINTFIFMSYLFNKYEFPYNTINFPIQNSIIILTPNANVHINSLKLFTGITKTKINLLFENLFENKNKLIECGICLKKSKKNNICYECYQFNGCKACGTKMIKKNMFDCVLCKS